MIMSDGTPIEGDPNASSCAEDRVSLAYENLKEIPKTVVELYGTEVKILDLSHNQIRDLTFLTNFRCLNSLILDKNPAPDASTLPYLPDLELLWLNHCDIDHISEWIFRIQNCCPELKFLSLMGNPGVTSLFNGNSLDEHTDYRMFVISCLPSLQHLDDLSITATDRALAKSHRSVHGFPTLMDGPFNIFERINKMSLKKRSSPANDSKGSSRVLSRSSRKGASGIGGSGKKKAKRKNEEKFECVSSTD